jgi:hypothetical protein
MTGGYFVPTSKQVHFSQQ